MTGTALYVGLAPLPPRTPEKVTRTSGYVDELWGITASEFRDLPVAGDLTKDWPPML